MVWIQCRAWLYWFIGANAFLLQLSLQVSSGLLAPSLDRAFQLGHFWGNILVSSVFVMHILLQIPAGLLVDRFGPRRIVGFGALICAFGGVMFAMATDFYSALFFRVIMGSGLSCTFVCLACIVSNWMPERQFSFALAGAEFAGLMGGATIELFLAQQISHLHWRDFFALASMTACVLGVVALLVLRDHPSGYVGPSLRTHEMKAVLREIMPKRLLWLNGLYSGALFGLHTGFVGSDGPLLLQSIPGISFLDAGWLCALIMLGAAFGLVAVSLLSLYTDYLRPYMVSFAFMTSVAMALLIWLPGPCLWLRAFLALVVGFFSSGYIFSFSVAKHYHSGRGRSILMGFTNMLSVLVGPLIAVLSGAVLRVILLADMAPLLAYQMTASFFVLACWLATLFALVLDREQDNRAVVIIES